MIDFNTKFDKSGLFLLKKIGIAFSQDQMQIYNQGDDFYPRAEIPYLHIKRISLHKTNERDFSFSNVLEIFRFDFFKDDNDYAAPIYALRIQFKSKKAFQTTVKDFDLISVSKLLE